MATEVSTSSVDFVQSLPLPARAAGPMAAAATGGVPQQTDGEESASVAGSSLVAFTANVSAQHKTDLLTSIGLAQLSTVAQKIDPTRDPLGYYNSIVKILNNIAFTAQNVSFANYNATTATVEMDQVVLEIMTALVGAGELALVQSALAALKAAADNASPVWQIYDSNSTANNNGCFSIGMANETNGSVAIQLGAFHFAASTTTTKFLWWSYSATAVSIQDGSTQLALNDAQYAKIRDAIEQKMTGHSKNYIDNLPL